VTEEGDDRMKLPHEVSETPYTIEAFRVVHFHEDSDEFPGTIVLEIAGGLPGTDAEVVVPFEMTPENALQLADELLHQYRCLVHGLPEEDEDLD